MRLWNASPWLLALSWLVYGCAAPAASQDEGTPEARVESQALSDDASLLALGDSIAFGYNPLGDFSKDKNFVGYPELLVHGGLKDASCPGETSASLFSATAPDNGCRAYRAAYPLHVNYGGNATQLDYALSRLAEQDDVPMQITLNVSGNDIFLLQAQCANDPRGPAACFAAGAPGLIGSIANNVATILGTLRGAGGYQGDLVYMNLYSLNYTDPNTVGFLTALNQNVSNVARFFGARIADAYGAFQAAAGSSTPCAAGLVIALPSGGCDVHPSPAGAQVLAQSVLDAH